MITRYWVGDGENWSDKKWAADSGGWGGYSPPGEKDTAVFDHNSGFPDNRERFIAKRLYFDFFWGMCI